MTWNMLLWKWDQDFDTPAKRRKAGVKNSEVAKSFGREGEHIAIGSADVQAVRIALDAEFGADEENRPFVVEDYGKCVVVNYPNDVRLEIAPKLGAIARKLRMNSCEF